MAFTSLEASAIAPGKPLPYTMLQTIKNNEDYLYGLSGGANSNGNLVYNGEFEIDSDNDGQPDGWTITPHIGGGSTLVTTATTWASPISGGKSLAISRAAGSSAAPAGGAVIRSDYFPVSFLDSYLVDIKAAIPTSISDNWEVGIGFETYTADKVLIETIVPGTGHYNIDTNWSRNYAIISLYQTSWLLSAASSRPKYARIMFNVGTTTDYSTNANSRVLIDSVNVTHFRGMSYAIEETTGVQLVTRATDWTVLNSNYYKIPLHNVPLTGEFSFFYRVIVASSAGTTVLGGSTTVAQIQVYNSYNGLERNSTVSMATTSVTYHSDAIPFYHNATGGPMLIGKACLMPDSSLDGSNFSRWMYLFQSARATVRIDNLEIVYI
jgi:hypothetical protein